MCKPEFWNDEEFFNDLKVAVQKFKRYKTKRLLYQEIRNLRLFFKALWNFSDDEGRFRANLTRLKGELFPFDEDFHLTTLQKFLNMLYFAKKVGLYQINGIWYGYIRNFKKHQTINRPTPSLLPPPPKDLFSEDSVSRYMRAHVRLTP